jgi:hypothetical protein
MTTDDPTGFQTMITVPKDDLRLLLDLVSVGAVAATAIVFSLGPLSYCSPHPT